MTLIRIIKNGKKAISTGDDFDIRIWNLETYQNLGVLRGHTGTINSFCLSKDGQTFISCSYDKSIRIWNLEEKK